jgi:Second Messenger Oligonucleotide or Dinucleotide Synthetase domain
MTVNSYLTSRASHAILSDTENLSIATSTLTLQKRLNAYFGGDVSTHFKFGSSTRGTILPRRMDERSDIDYMVVFSEGGYTPQTYLNKLKKFVEYYYSSSEIKQSSPCIVLELNHIKFELVPALAYAYPYSGYKIPDGPSAWQDTDPHDFNSKLNNKNTQNGSFIKPAIRLLKFWNAHNGYVFNSFSLEKWVVDQWYYPAENVRDILLACFEKLNVPTDTQWRKDVVERAQKTVENVRIYERANWTADAELEVKKLIPE